LRTFEVEYDEKVGTANIKPTFQYILGSRVDHINYDELIQRVMDWAQDERSHYVCAATAHMIMEAYDSDEFRQILNSADLITPDGMPLVWLLRWLGGKEQEQVCGPQFTTVICEAAAQNQIPIGFYGGSPETLRDMVSNLKKNFPDLNIVYVYSPPYRPLTPAEDAAISREIQNSGAKILFVGLGCPKQERWMAGHKNRFDAVMLGVGAAFDFHAGRLKRAPRWIRKLGFEWVFRLMMEPRRLWKRYLKHHPRFMALVTMQLLGLYRNEEVNG
jgi:N-acetylglucosaminyldiphosphoundecaprenol N-acetyl-beta-D-mannosaminyltransferase